MVMPKLEPGTEGETAAIPISALTGDPTQTQLVTLNAQGQVIHNDKVYQLCEFLKPGGDEKMIMMAQVQTLAPDMGDGSDGTEVQVVEAQSIQMTEEIPTEEMGEEMEDDEEAPEQEVVTHHQHDSSHEIQMSEETGEESSQLTA